MTTTELTQCLTEIAESVVERDPVETFMKLQRIIEALKKENASTTCNFCGNENWS